MSKYTLYQEFNSIFLGIPLEMVHANMDESTLAESYYYHLDRSDCKFKQKFQSNLKLMRKIQDRDYAEFLFQLVEDKVESIDDLLNPEVSLNILPKPKIVKIAPNQNTLPVKIYIPNEELCEFLVSENYPHDVTQIYLFELKQFLNGWIRSNNLQNNSRRTHILVNKKLAKLLDFSEDEITWENFHRIIRRNLRFPL